MDFIHDRLDDGRTIRILTAIDVFSRECVALEPSTTFRGTDVAHILGDAGSERGLPGRIHVDNGTEFLKSSSTRFQPAGQPWLPPRLENARYTTSGGAFTKRVSSSRISPSRSSSS